MSSQTFGQQAGDSANDSMRTVLVALVAGLGVAFAKAGAAAVTGSSALSAEASHSLADSANDVFLLIAQRRSARPASERHPLGHGREAYFWALIAACAAFFAGAAFSLRDGINELVHPGTTSSFGVAYIVLGVSAVFDLVSFRQSAGQLIGRSRRYRRSVIEEARVTSDPALRAVFVEDTASVSGDVLALAALAINQITGSSTAQGVVAVLIGLILIRVSLRLIRRSHDFLVGVWVSVPAPPGDDERELTPAIRPEEADRVNALVSNYRGVAAVRELIAMFIGPGTLWIVARIEIDDHLRGPEVTSLARGIESELRRQFESIARVDIVPIGSQDDGRPAPPSDAGPGDETAGRD